MKPPQRKSVELQQGPRSRAGRRLTPASQLPSHVRNLGTILKAAYIIEQRRAGGKTNLLPGHYVYVGTNRGTGTYVGITSNMAARQGQHRDRFHLHALNPTEQLSKIEARAAEQYLIQRQRFNPHNQNIAQSISRRHPYYDKAMAFGKAFYNWAKTTHGRSFFE